jgi:uncharacterized protein YjbI with pentapeptide repeats
VSWFFGKSRTAAGHSSRPDDPARPEVAQELRQLRETVAKASDKSFWDKFAVIIQLVGAVAVIVPLFALWVSVSQFNQQQKESAAASLDQQRQDTLDAYFDDMSALVLGDQLMLSKVHDPVRAIADARTLTAVRDLDGTRKATLIRYLWEAGLLEPPDPIVNITDADLSGADFSDADLNHIALIQVSLDGAQFVNATQLVGANLSGSDLENATLVGTDLTDADLAGSFPVGADFSGATLTDTNLAKSDLYGANFTKAELAGTDLKGSYYNSKPENDRTPQGTFIVEQPTRWPKGFDPQAHGAICYDCAGA